MNTKWHDEPGGSQVVSFGITINGHKLIVRGPDRYQTHWTAKIDGADIAPGQFDSEQNAKQAATNAAKAKK